MTFRWKKIIAWAFVAVMLVAVYAPILLLIVYSFVTVKGGAFVGISFSGYIDMFNDAKLMGAVLNTLILAIVSAGLATLLGTFTAIGLFSMRKPPRQAIGAANQVTVVNADIVTGVSFALLFIVVRNIGLDIPDGWITLIIAHVMITTPYVILTVLPRLRQLNPNVYEAALDLGARPWTATVRILLPQLIGAMIAGFALAFTLSLDDFVITKHNRGDINTISTLIYGAMKKKDVPYYYRAFSALFFVLILAVLLAINIRAARTRNHISKAQNK